MMLHSQLTYGIKPSISLHQITAAAVAPSVTGVWSESETPGQDIPIYCALRSCASGFQIISYLCESKTLIL